MRLRTAHITGYTEYIIASIELGLFLVYNIMSDDVITESP